MVYLYTLIGEISNNIRTGMLLMASAEQLRLERGLPGTFKDVSCDQFKKTLTSTQLTDLLFILEDNYILLHDSLYPNYIHIVRGYIFNIMLSFIQSHRQRITLSHGLQRILTSYHISRNHISRRKGTHVIKHCKADYNNEWSSSIRGQDNLHANIQTGICGDKLWYRCYTTQRI